jgi:hypothetical protein
MALMTVNDDETEDGRSKPRWSSGKKFDVVLRLLRGEKLDALGRELGVEAHRIAAWRDDLLSGGKEALKGRRGPSFQRGRASGITGMHTHSADRLSDLDQPEAVKAFETTPHRFVCMSASGVGWLIHAATGSFGGAGGRAKRWGLAA